MNAPLFHNFVWLHDSDARELFPGRLWSLCEMLSHFGFAFFVTGEQLAHAERDLIRYLGGGESNRHVTFDNPVLKSLNSGLSAIMQMDKPVELQPIIKDAKKLYNRINDKQSLRNISTADLIVAVKELSNDLRELSIERKMYYIRQDLIQFYGHTDLFGPYVFKKFKGSMVDLEHAGNCLALGENTACILHLVRAMESALRVLGKKLGVSISPRDTWGVILNGMSGKIEKLPEATDAQKRKKAHWSECRANLYHIKQAWRDESFHTTRFYDEREARQIVEAIRVFMGQLATL